MTETVPKYIVSGVLAAVSRVIKYNLETYFDFMFPTEK